MANKYTARDYYLLVPIIGELYGTSEGVSMLNNITGTELFLQSRFIDNPSPMQKIKSDMAFKVGQRFVTEFRSYILQNKDFFRFFYSEIMRSRRLQNNILDLYKGSNILFDISNKFRLFDTTLKDYKALCNYFTSLRDYHKVFCTFTDQPEKIFCLDVLIVYLLSNDFERKNLEEFIEKNQPLPEEVKKIMMNGQAFFMTEQMQNSANQMTKMQNQANPMTKMPNMGNQLPNMGNQMPNMGNQMPGVSSNVPDPMKKKGFFGSLGNAFSRVKETARSAFRAIKNPFARKQPTSPEQSSNSAITTFSGSNPLKSSPGPFTGVAASTGGYRKTSKGRKGRKGRKTARKAKKSRKTRKH